LLRLSRASSRAGSFSFEKKIEGSRKIANKSFAKMGKKGNPRKRVTNFEKLLMLTMIEKR
jgi:hypothetical protein